MSPRRKGSASIPSPDQTLLRKILKARLDASQGKIPCDLLIQNARFLDVFTGTWQTGDLAIYDGTIVSFEGASSAKRRLNARGKWVVPGFIDAHVHVESSLLTPESFDQAVLKCGTTTAICDPHEIANVLGPQGIEYFLESAQKTQMDLWVMMSSCVPATELETNGGGTILSPTLARLGRHPKSLGLAEVMNIPAVLAGETEMLKKLISFASRPKDGHSPVLRGKDLSTYACAGLSSCHESSSLEEGREKLSKGISLWIREGSVAKDLKALCPLLNTLSSPSIGFCTDDRNPLDIQTEGHIDYLVREALRLGATPEAVFRSASWSVAAHYQLNQFRADLRRVGAIAPGYQADLLILDDLKTCSIQKVLKSGQLFDELPFPSAGSRVDRQFLRTVRVDIPEASALEGATGRVHVIGVLPGKILTERRILDSSASGVARLTVLERHGKRGKPANGYVEGFGSHFRGAIASSVGHDSHNLIVAGSNTEDMRIGLGALAKMQGGFCVVQGRKVIASLALPLAGLMSTRPASEIVEKLVQLKAASRAIGCELEEPFLQLAFLSLPVIPSLKLTNLGLVDVEKFQIIPVRAN